MKNIKIIALFILISNYLYSQQAEERWKTIKGDLRSSDTVFLVNEWNIFYYQGDTFVHRNAVYIETNKSSAKYYRDRIGDFGLKNRLSEKNEYYYLKYKNIDNLFYYSDDKEEEWKEIPITLKKRKIPENFPIKWLPLYSYNNEYYLYAPCQWVFEKYNITDTLIMFYGWMDGIYGFSYNTIVQKSENHYTIQGIKNFHNKKINIYIIDREKGIAVFEYDNYPLRLFVDAEKIENFPVIVHYCEELELEYEFPYIDLKKLIEKIKNN